MAGLKDILKKVGLCPMKLESGGSVNTMALVEAMFDAIVDECRKGGTVRIKDFGTFSARMNKGRKLKSPLMKDGEVEFGDILLMKFHQSSVSKQRLNRDRAVEAWGGKYVERKKRPSDIKKEEAAAKKKMERAAKKKANVSEDSPSKKKSTTTPKKSTTPSKKKSTTTPKKSTTTPKKSTTPPKKKSSPSKKSSVSSSKKKSASTTTSSPRTSPPSKKKSSSKSKTKSKK